MIINSATKEEISIENYILLRNTSYPCEIVSGKEDSLVSGSLSV